MKAHVLLLCTLLLWAHTAQAAGSDKRMALVIGNARYAALPLNNPENDARVMAVTLRRLGFEVTEHVNLGVKEFRKVMRDFARRIQASEGASVFYYAGHGVQIDGRNFLLPVDINLRDQDEVRDEGVDIDELYVNRLERARTQVRIVILDACRDDPFGGKTRSTRGAGGLAEMAARGALIAYATAPGATAEDGPTGTNSVFTRHLAREMLVEGVEVEQMFKNVRVGVMRDTGQRQMPWVNSSLTVNFSFNPARGSGTDDSAKREDLTRLQTMLSKSELDQKRLEEQVRMLTKRLEQSASTPGSAKPAAGPAPASTVAVAPPTVKPPKVLPAAPAAPKPARPKASDAGEARLAMSRPEPPSPQGARAPGKGGAASERCVALLIRAQLGEPVSPADMSFMQKECR